MSWLAERKWILAGFGLAAVLMGVINGTSYQNATQLIESTNRSRQTYEVIKNLVDVFAEMTVAESGRRGYVFLNDQAELERYRVAVRAVHLEMEALRSKLLTEPQQLQAFSKLENLLNRRLKLFEQSIQLHQRDRTAQFSQQQITAESVALRGAIQAAISDMQREEDRLLHQWLHKSQESIRTRMLIEFLVTCLSFALLAALSLLLYRQVLKRQEIKTYKASLEKEKELNELKLNFFSMVSHEFRTPLSVILGSSQLLAESNGQWSEDRRLKNIHRIQSSAQLMTQLLTDILTLSRAAAGKLECNPLPLDIEAFCLNLIEDLAASNANLQHIQFECEGQCGLVQLDEKLLYSILSNLLSNALKYSATDSTIQLRLICSSEQTRFEVVDTGIGIPTEDHNQLYQPFYRGQNVAEIKGTGLGLAVVKQCVDLHQGAIAVESQAGIGTTFMVEFPRA
jgi:signal transduction histidine kinase